MKTALRKDILRTIGNEKKRFFSILLITMLGVTMLTGLRASCNDLRWSADALSDEEKLFDIQISSTLGLDDEDIAALEGIDEAEIVEGEYSEDVFTEVAGVHEEVTVRTMGERMNIPTVLEGSLPVTDDEVAVTEEYILNSGKKIGDTLTFAREETDEDDDPVFEEKDYTITAVIIDPFDVNNREGGVSFRSAATTKYTFFVLPSAADTDIYTSIYVYLKNTAELMCFGDEYKQIVRNVKNEINDTLKEERQQGRYDKVYGDALGQYEDAYADAMLEIGNLQQDIDEARKQLDAAQEEIDSGQREIDDGWTAVREGESELAEGRSELEMQEAEAERQIAEAGAEISAGHNSLYASKAELDAAGQQIAEGEQQLSEAEAELAEARKSTLGTIDDGIAQIRDGQAQLSSGIEQAESALSGLTSEADSLRARIEALKAEDPEENAILIEELERQLVTLETQQTQLNEQLAALRQQKSELDARLITLQQQRTQAEEEFDAAQAQLDAQAAEFAAGKKEYESGLSQWYAGLNELDAAQAQLDSEAALAGQEISSAWETIRSSEQEMADAQQQLIAGQQELDDGQKEHDDAQKEVDDGQQELDENTEAALNELVDARSEIDNIAVAKWYIQTRDSLSSYSNIENDASSIQGLGNFVPWIFFIVAILISLTAITRMVEEDRGLVGTYKALGFKNREIRRKYMVYAAVASLIGGVAGDFVGFIILPKIIFIFFKSMYLIPDYMLRFETASGTIGILMFLAGILIAVLYAVHGELAHMPATLMRPTVPKGGTRIFLDHIPFIWNRLSFLNKVTARNLFRYKKHLFMTIIGIMGCTGLLICGFGINNTVTDLNEKQYDNVTRYDILAIALDDDKLLSYMDDPENIREYLSIEVDSMTLMTGPEDMETVQVFIIPDDAPIGDYIKLADLEGTETGLAEDGIMITHSIGKVFGLDSGDIVTLQDLSLNETDIPIAMVTENYLGDMVYISESSYEKYFGKEADPNAALILLTENCGEGDPIAYADALGAKDGILSTSSRADMQSSLSQAFKIMDAVVYVIVVLAAGLAFVVLYTLATTNISEREREIATIKVLGFFDAGVHMYINKETVILSCIGIALGLPVGRILTSFICWFLKIPGIYFAASVHSGTYLLCIVITLVFTLLVNQITNRILNRIDPAVALKSIE